MIPVSVVLIAKNEAHIIGNTLQSLQGLTDDIVVGDNGSTDNTMQVATQAGARVVSISWEGYGITKNKAIALARYDWILALDADEAIDDTLKKALLALDLDNEKVIYRVKYLNYIGRQKVRFGEWLNFSKIRLFNRKQVKWNKADVHETLALPPGIIEKKLPGLLLHSSIRDLQEYAHKMTHYGELMANKYFRNGKKAGWFKLYPYPLFVFLKNYIFRLGFLDGGIGFTCARFSSFYTFFKYHRLKELRENQKNKAGLQD
jgi:glycosyltransferase involved in cell wall biosynthesis